MPVTDELIDQFARPGQNRVPLTVYEDRPMKIRTLPPVLWIDRFLIGDDITLGRVYWSSAQTYRPGDELDALAIQRKTRAVIEYDKPIVSMEAPWKDNKAHVSCIPTGQYSLQPHDLEPWRDTFALVGKGVSRFKHPACPLHACVIHPAGRPERLSGCIAFGLEYSPGSFPVSSTSHHVLRSPPVTDHVVAKLRSSLDAGFSPGVIITDRQTQVLSDDWWSFLIFKAFGSEGVLPKLERDRAYDQGWADAQKIGGDAFDEYLLS